MACHAGNERLPAGYRIVSSYDAANQYCGCMQALARAATAGGSHHREKRAAAEPQPAKRQSERLSCKTPVYYAEECAEDENSQPQSQLGGSNVVQQSYLVPQCKAHGQHQHKNVQQVIKCVQTQMAGCNKWAVFVEWPLQNGQGKSRAASAATPGKHNSGKMAGKFMAGSKRHVDVVLAAEFQGNWVALGGIEVNGAEHHRARRQGMDSEKTKFAGFPIMSVGANDDAFEIESEVTCLLHNIRL